MLGGLSSAHDDTSNPRRRLSPLQPFSFRKPTLRATDANHLASWANWLCCFATNPIAVGIPTQDEPPVIFDMATTVAAYGKVRAKRGKMMPPGWMIDREGQPLLDPVKSAEGLLLPIGRHMGYGLSLVAGRF